MHLTLKKPFRNAKPLIMPESTTHGFGVYPWWYASKSLVLLVLDMVKGGYMNFRT